MRALVQPPRALTVDLAARPAEYELAAIGTNVCPAGDVQITDAAECRRAATSVGKNSDIDDSYASMTRPAGCYWNTTGYAHFNSHATGGTNMQAGKICKKGRWTSSLAESCWPDNVQSCLTLHIRHSPSFRPRDQSYHAPSLRTPPLTV